MRTGIVLAVSLLVACSSEAPAPAATATARDSAGVRIVELPPLDSLGVPEWKARRLFTTASIDEDDLQLYQVADALFLDDGTLVIANGGRTELVYVDRTGKAARHVGRSGQGPGEFGRFLSALLRDPSGDVVAFDGRLSRFAPDGTFRDMRRLDFPNMFVTLKPLARLTDGRMLAVLAIQNFFPSSGERRDTVPLMLIDSARVDTIGTWKGLERAFETTPQGRAKVPIGFARSAYAVSNGRRTAIGSTDSLDLTVYDGTPAPVLFVRARSAPPPVTERDVARWRDLLADYLESREFMALIVRESWDRGPVRETLPAFEGLRLDDADRLWIGDYADLDATQRTWIVLGTDGIPIARVTLPVDHRDPYPVASELLAVGRDRLALLRRSELDEESVEVWSFEP